MMEIRAKEAGMTDVFNAVRWYLYHRPDSMGAGYVYGWKTNQDNKITILNQFRDEYSLNHLVVRSVELLGEMQKTVQDGGEIKGAGRAKDDRVFATALANKAWLEWVRNDLVANNQSYSEVTQKELDALENEGKLQQFHEYLVQDFFKRKEMERSEAVDRRVRPILPPVKTNPSWIYQPMAGQPLDQGWGKEKA